MEGCPGCKAVKELIKEFKVESRFTFVDIHDNYDGFIPEQVPVLQDEAVGTVPGEHLEKFLTKLYGKEE